MKLLRRKSSGTKTPALSLAVALALGALPGAAIDGQSGDFKWSWGTTLTYGLGLRLDDPDKRIIGAAAGGTAFSVNGDDGDQNYETGIFTNAGKVTTGRGHLSRTRP